MPQSPNQSIKNQFNKGLLTEFSELAFPENASIDELNCDLFKAGNRTRRLGVQYEEGGTVSSQTLSNEPYFQIVGLWRRVGKEEGVQFVVVQAGKFLFFYEKTDGALSQNPVPVSDSDPTIFGVNLTTYQVGDAVNRSPVQVASINGRLVVVGESIDAFYIERDTTDNSFMQSRIDFLIRDFEWQGDINDYFSNGTADALRLYDTYNAGWNDSESSATTARNSFLSSSGGDYPSLNLPWFSAKNSSGVFDYTEWDRTYKGTTLIANGHYLLDPFDERRSFASGIGGVPVVTTTRRFSSVVTFASRIFYAGLDSRVFFTQTFENDNEFGNLYQRNDPTAEVFNDLLDTDGGVINIPEAVNIKRLHVFGASIMVFADNGVWRISGVDGVFRATEYSVYKVSDEGLATSKSFVAGQNAVPFWWSFNGIHTIQVTDGGGMVEANLSKDTIQTFWNSIDSNGKQGVRGTYDAIRDRVVWLYPENGEAVSSKCNRLLFLDTELGAFFPWAVSDQSVSTSYLLDGVYLDSQVRGDVTLTVTDSSEVPVTDSLGDDVTVTYLDSVIGSSAIKFLTIDSGGFITFSTFTDTDFTDWGDTDYTSYAEAAYNFIGDLGRRKSSNYLTVFTRATETAFEVDGDTYVFDRPSSLLVSNYWDFKNVATTSQQQAYRLRRPVVANPSLVYDQDRTVNAVRLKMRGRGRVIRHRFESEAGKDFNLLGWEMLGGVNPRY